MNDIAVHIENLGKQYRIGGNQAPYKTIREAIVDAVKSPFRKAVGLLRGEAYSASGLDKLIWVLRGITLDVKRGEVVGVIGGNGAGKTTLLKILSRITEPTEGRARIWGRVGSLLEVGTGFHPELTGRENIYLNGAILGMTRSEVDKKFDEIVGFAEVEKFINTPVKHFSSGMYLRLAFSVAAHLEPEILLIDEVLAVGDAAFQKKCLGKMEEVGREGRTVVFVSHDMASVSRLCSRVIMLHGGEVLRDGDPSSVIQYYLADGADIVSSRKWDDNTGRPHVADMRSVRIVDIHDNPLVTADIEEPVIIKLEFVYRKVERELYPVIQLINELGQSVFVSAANYDEVFVKDHRRPGKYISKCEIPGNLLAEGTFYVSIYLMCWEPKEYYFREEQVAAFRVVDRLRGGSARGKWARGGWPGVVRPMLSWSTIVNSDV